MLPTVPAHAWSSCRPGVDPTHPDLDGRIVSWINLTETEPPTGGPSEAHDRQGYGTIIASLAVGRDSSGEIIGMAPQTDLLVAKVLNDDGSGSSATILNGMSWCLSQDADIVLMALGTGDNQLNPIFSKIYKEIYASGMIVVDSTGNEGPGRVLAPGNEPSSLTVGATDEANVVASFSGGGGSLGQTVIHG